LAIVFVAVAVCAVAPGGASAGVSRAASAPADRAAVHAYLLDLYTYAQAVAEVAPRAVAAYEGAASGIAGECPGVLVGAPQENAVELGPLVVQRTARQRGEEKRQSRQLSDLEVELAQKLDSAELEQRQPALRALLAGLQALPQGGPLLSRLVHAQTFEAEAGLKVESADVCADMRVWAASGYRTLSAASRGLALKREAELAEFSRYLSTLAEEKSLSAMETPADKALVRETDQLDLRVAKAVSDSVDGARKRVDAALGLTALEHLEKRFGPPSHESKTSTKLGAGRTAAGNGYTVWLERAKGGRAGGCKSSVEVRGADGAKPGIAELLTATGSEICLAPRSERSEEPNVDCRDGLLTIETEVLPATRAVDLRMSNGARVVSHPVLVPRRLGGPDAFYYQAVRGPSPVPLSLSERDAQGRTLRVLKLRPIVGCSRRPLKYLRGGKRALVSGRAPQGPSFSIVGERYRLFGRIHTQLKLRTGEGLSSSDDSEEEEGLNEVLGGPPGMPVKRGTLLDSEVSAACYPSEYSIFYGLLRQPRDTVLAKIAGKLLPVLRVRIPSSLHAGGLLVYLASVSRPEELLVRSPSGKVLMDDDLSRVARESRETCEGESEGSGPPPGGFIGGGETRRIVL
jgi:hypothetical protein